MIKAMNGDVTRAPHFNKTLHRRSFVCQQRQLEQTRQRDLPIGINNKKNTTTTPSETCYLDTTINIGKENRTVRISVYDKREDFNFRIVNFLYLNSNIP